MCSNLISPTGPHFPRHAPPLPQQVGPSLLSTHLGHSETRREECVNVCGHQIVLIINIHGCIISAMVLLPSTGGRVRICISLAQALTPSPHEYAYLGSPGAAHLPCQAPLLPQQLSPPFLGAHLGHSEKNGMHMCVCVCVCTCVRACVRACVCIRYLPKLLHEKSGNITFEFFWWLRCCRGAHFVTVTPSVLKYGVGSSAIVFPAPAGSTTT